MAHRPTYLWSGLVWLGAEKEYVKVLVFSRLFRLNLSIVTVWRMGKLIMDAQVPSEMDVRSRILWKSEIAATRILCTTPKHRNSTTSTYYPDALGHSTF